jgi:prepilin peptidase CpaA
MLTNATVWFALVTAAFAVFTDLRARRIPNALTLGSATAALAFHLVAGSPLRALTGCAVGLCLFLPVYMLRGLGAGDVKLLAAIGAWVGPSLALWTGLYGAIAGGVLAIVVSFGAGYTRELFANLRLLFTHWRVVGMKPLDQVSLEGGRGPRLAYAIPIAVGVVSTLWLR